MLNRLFKRGFAKRFDQWMVKRAPLNSQVELKHKTIYVFPGRQGLAFLFLIALIWLLGTNYQNNNILGFCFLLVSVLVLSIFFAFKNLLGLRIKVAAVQSSTLGEKAIFDVHVSSGAVGAHKGIYLDVGNGESPVGFDLGENSEQLIRLVVDSKHRGWQKLPRVTLVSHYPFGVIRAWSYLHLDHKALIFPKPIENTLRSFGGGEPDSSGSLTTQVGDEFAGFSPYQAGQPLTQVAWKLYARGAGLLVKDYRQQESQSIWLNWDDFSSVGTETALSHMAYWVEEFYKNHESFGLRLPRKVINPAQGEAHRLEVLTALALFGWIPQ